MRLSVVVPAHNERDELAACLDALSAEAADVEIVVVNGPSTDGTSGMVRDRDDVDVLLECASRNINVARNAGMREACGDAFAMLAPVYRVQPGWYDTVMDTLAGNADLVTGPVRLAGTDPDHHETPRRSGTRITGGNVALTREALTALDGFDEYLVVGGGHDLGQRVAGHDLQVVWHPEMGVRAEHPRPEYRRQHRGGYAAAWQGSETVDWGSRYRSLAYRTVKNDGIGLRTLRQLLGTAGRDAVAVGRDVFGGTVSPSHWLANGVTVVRNSFRGIVDGYRARRDDRTPARNPHGLSQAEADVVVDRYGP